MVMSDRVDESHLDDTQGIDLNIENLYNRFILPIERIRSFSSAVMVDRPVIKSSDELVNNAANTANVNPLKPQESRAHAFYRMIGFPVIAQTGEFYSPGYDPSLQTNQRVKNYNISTKISKTM